MKSTLRYLAIGICIAAIDTVFKLPWYAGVSLYVIAVVFLDAIQEARP